MDPRAISRDEHAASASTRKGAKYGISTLGLHEVRRRGHVLFGWPYFLS